MGGENEKGGGRRRHQTSAQLTEGRSTQMGDQTTTDPQSHGSSMPTTPLPNTTSSLGKHYHPLPLHDHTKSYCRHITNTNHFATGNPTLIKQLR